MKSSISRLSVAQLKSALIIREQIDLLQDELMKVLNGDAAGRVSGEKSGAPVSTDNNIKKRKKRHMSASVRAKMAAAAKKRWAAVKAAGRRTL